MRERTNREYFIRYINSENFFAQILIEEECTFANKIQRIARSINLSLINCVNKLYKYKNLYIYILCMCEIQ